jgi:hypothetical protein
MISEFTVADYAYGWVAGGHDVSIVYRTGSNSWDTAIVPAGSTRLPPEDSIFCVQRAEDGKFVFDPRRAPAGYLSWGKAKDARFQTLRGVPAPTRKRSHLRFIKGGKK